MSTTDEPVKSDEKEIVAEEEDEVQDLQQSLTETEATIAPTAEVKNEQTDGSDMDALEESEEAKAAKKLLDDLVAEKAADIGVEDEFIDISGKEKKDKEIVETKTEEDKTDLEPAEEFIAIEEEAEANSSTDSEKAATESTKSEKQKTSSSSADAAKPVDTVKSLISEWGEDEEEDDDEK